MEEVDVLLYEVKVYASKNDYISGNFTIIKECFIEGRKLAFNNVGAIFRLENHRFKDDVGLEGKALEKPQKSKISIKLADKFSDYLTMQDKVDRERQVLFSMQKLLPIE